MMSRLPFFLILLVGIDSQLHSTDNQALENVVMSLGRQLMEEQLFVEERIRSEGMSGVKKVRQYHEGTSPYFTDTHIGGAALAMHDHSNYDRTMGIGEFIAVMDGVEFRTRHNDYKLRMPSTKSSTYQETEFIEMPLVPPEVLSKATVQEQVVEMKEWFRAFREQNATIRDYRPYFKPNLCILEGAWTLPTSDMEEPFQSDRHHIDATTWDDLTEKIRFTAYTGAKHNLENFAFLPKKLYGFSADGMPQFAQWNYRIVCHPVSFDLPTSYFKVQNDLAHRLTHSMNMDSIEKSRAARFKINEFPTARETIYTVLDSMMAEVPGLDNYGANLTEETYGLQALDVDMDTPLNAAYYSRWYKYDVEGAMGVSINHRGFNDENLWVALNTQLHIMPLSTEYCDGTCEKTTRRASFAMPLEVIYTTPLFNWNPYDVAFYEGDPAVGDASYVAADGRNGGLTDQTAYNGTNSRTFYRTPIEFYRSTAVEVDYADTAQESVGVLDKQGSVQKMAASGPRIITPDIEGVGQVRLRYPIFPVHSEGSTVGEELMALKEIVMNLKQYSYLLNEVPGGNGTPVASPFVHFTLRETNRDPPGVHSHDFQLARADDDLLRAGGNLTVTTSLALGHSHELVIAYDAGSDVYSYLTCDRQKLCWDGHPTDLADDA